MTFPIIYRFIIFELIVFIYFEDDNDSLFKFFDKINQSINGNFNCEIHDWNVIKYSISILINNNVQGAGCNIVDFIDLGNWDRISAFSFNDSMRRLELEWHQNDKFHIYIESIVFVELNDTMYAFLKDTIIIQQL